MERRSIPEVFQQLLEKNCIQESDIIKARDGFALINKSIADILFEKGILDFPDSEDAKLLCNSFFDDWYLYAVPDGKGWVYSLLKLREQEHDAEDGSPADGDVPGVTISFISFRQEMLLHCLEDPVDENRKKLGSEINRVVAYKGQRHHRALKQYFLNPQSQAAYLVASVYTRYIASLAANGSLEVPEYYKTILQQSISYKKSAKLGRLPKYIAALNERAGKVICDNEKILIMDGNCPSEEECLAILATHTGNTSVYSFAAEVEYHAKYLTALARIRIPFFGKSIYDSAIRADMTVGDTEFQGPAPFYREDSRIVKRQHLLHKGYKLGRLQ